MALCHFPQWLLTSHLGFSSPCSSIFRSDNRHVGSGSAWVFLHSNCLFHHFLRLLHHCYWSLVTGALFLKKQIKKKLNFSLLPSWYNYSTDFSFFGWKNPTFYPTICSRDSEKGVFPVSDKLCWHDWAQCSKQKSCEASIKYYQDINGYFLIFKSALSFLFNAQHRKSGNFVCKNILSVVRNRPTGFQSS